MIFKKKKNQKTLGLFLSFLSERVQPLLLNGEVSPSSDQNVLIILLSCIFHSLLVLTIFKWLQQWVAKVETPVLTSVVRTLRQNSKYTCSKDLRAPILQTFTLSYNCTCSASPVEINNIAFTIKIQKKIRAFGEWNPSFTL